MGSSATRLPKEHQGCLALLWAFPAQIEENYHRNISQFHLWPWDVDRHCMYLFGEGAVYRYWLNVQCQQWFHMSTLVHRHVADQPLHCIHCFWPVNWTTSIIGLQYLLQWQTHVNGFHGSCAKLLLYVFSRPIPTSSTEISLSYLFTLG